MMRWYLTRAYPLGAIATVSDTVVCFETLARHAGLPLSNSDLQTLTDDLNGLLSDVEQFPSVPEDYGRVRVAACYYHQKRYGRHENLFRGFSCTVFWLMPNMFVVRGLAYRSEPIAEYPTLTKWSAGDFVQSETFIRMLRQTNTDYNDGINEQWRNSWRTI